MAYLNDEVIKEFGKYRDNIIDGRGMILTMRYT
jgi:hypothetical protein